MNYNPNDKEVSKIRFGTIFVSILIAVIICFLWLCAFRPHLVNPYLNNPNEQYIQNGVSKLTLEGHDYYRLGEMMVHSENCKCKK